MIDADLYVGRLKAGALDEANEIPFGRSGQIDEWDLANTQSKIRTGLPLSPLPCWRW